MHQLNENYRATVSKGMICRILCNRIPRNHFDDTKYIKSAISIRCGLWDFGDKENGRYYSSNPHYKYGKHQSFNFIINCSH